MVWIFLAWFFVVCLPCLAHYQKDTPTPKDNPPQSNDLATQNQNLSKDTPAQNQTNTKTSNFSEIYKKHEAIKHEINELKESYFSPQATTNYEPQRKAKIELLSDKKRQ